jgi:WD40 repeat protein
MWRFVGFVIMVLLGLAAVFYYTGLNEDPGRAKAARERAVQARVVKAPLQEARPVAPVAAGPMANNPFRFGRAITMTGETRPKEEQEVTSEVDIAAIIKLHVEVGASVNPGDMLVELDDRKISQELEAQRIQAGKVSEAKINNAKLAEAVYATVVERSSQTERRGATSKQDYDMDVARWKSAASEVIKSTAEMAFENARLKALEQQHELYKLKSRIPGTVVRVARKPGHNLRQGEQVMTIVNDKTLVAEGAVEAGFTTSLKKGMTIVVEPENDRESMVVFDGHTGPITSLALAPQARFLASSSEDGSVLLWSLRDTQPWASLIRPDRRRVACKSVAISPAVTGESYQLLAGYADGNVYQWTIKIPVNGALKIESQLWDKKHDQAINAIGYRGDGKYVATGSDDRRVGMWDAATGKVLYWVHAESSDIGNAHHGAVTTVLFSKQGQHLTTSGTDNTLRRWKLGTEGSELERTMPGRSGEVTKLNLADDGRYLFAEHNDELALLDSRTLEPKSVVTSRRSGRFVQFALFSADGALAVAATDQGRNMLIRLPKLPDAVEVAQTPDKALISPVSTQPSAPQGGPTTKDLWLREGAIGAHFTLPEAVRATCAQFVTSGERTFVLMGSTDNKIRLWEAPASGDLNEPILARLKFVSPQVESGTGLVRVQAEFENTRKIETGKRVSMIVFPDASDHVVEQKAPSPPAAPEKAGEKAAQPNNGKPPVPPTANQTGQ